MDGPMCDERAGALVDDVEVDDQTRSLGTTDEGTRAEDMTEGVPAGHRDLHRRPATSQRIDRSGARVLWKAAAAECIGAGVHDEARSRVAGQLGPGIENPVASMDGRVNRALVDR